jgi:hypothetical protein
MSVSIETSGIGFSTLDADREYNDAGGDQIYKNLRFRKTLNCRQLARQVPHRGGVHFYVTDM